MALKLESGHTNLTVLDQSPYAVAPETLKDISVWGAMLEGRVQPVTSSRAAASDDRSRIGRMPGDDEEIERDRYLGFGSRRSSPPLACNTYQVVMRIRMIPTGRMDQTI